MLVDGRLCSLNAEYEQKRRSCRLGPLKVSVLQHGAFEAYKRHCVAQGQREGPFKPVALCYCEQWGFDFKGYWFEGNLS